MTIYNLYNAEKKDEEVKTKNMREIASFSIPRLPQLP